MKSGTNQLRGTAYTFVRNGALDATNYFAPKSEPDPEYQRTQAGFSIGGPIMRDRTFFFADYEATRADEGITRVTTVPTDAARNALPACLTHPVGRAIAGLFPSPNRAVLNRQLRDFAHTARSHRSFRCTQRRGIRCFVRLDDAIQLRRSTPVRAVQRSGVFVATRDTVRTSRGEARISSPARTQILSPNLLNETRVGFNRISAGVVPGAVGNVNRAVGLPERWTNPRDAGLSLITVSGYSPLGHEYNNPQSGTTNTIHLADTLTWTRGNHLVKGGFDGRLMRQNAFRDVQARGTLTFTGAFTGNSLIDLLSGLPTFTTLASVDNPQRLRAESYAWFVQDSFRIRPRLTLSAGLRYEIGSPPVDADDRASLYNPQTRNLEAVGGGGLPAGRL